MKGKISTLKMIFKIIERNERTKYMKKVLLIGDSIRMGYDHYVREKLEGKL